VFKLKKIDVNKDFIEEHDFGLRQQQQQRIVHTRCHGDDEK
jgi:hypothetical protein